MNIEIHKGSGELPDVFNNPEQYGFGKLQTERMFIQRYLEKNGWHGAAIGHRKAVFPWLDPSSAVFHYGQEIFEGSKAYRRDDGNINVFRIWDNMDRFNSSAARMAMPQVERELHYEAIMRLLWEEKHWVPPYADTSIYIRPAMIAIEQALGVHASNEYLHFILLTLAGRYFANGFQPIGVQIEDKLRRAVKGGVGRAKTGGNYAASLLASEAAKAEGMAQVLWLDAQRGQRIEEVGAMNICFVYGSDIITPSLESGSILAGITRDSIRQLAPTLGYTFYEEDLDVGDMLSDIESGAITEVFGCGTAAVIAPIGRFRFQGRIYTINNNEPGSVAVALNENLTGIQYGKIPDPFGWTETIKVKE